MCPRFVRLLALVLALASTLPAAAPAIECAARNRPGATLLFPYFEADLDDAGAQKTLISIQNTSAEAVLTNVVVWTNCALPVLSFNLALAAEGSRSVDLRDLLANGRIPVSGDDVAFPDCAMPVAEPSLDEAALLTLQARLTGQPAPDDGKCYARPNDPTTLASGFITVDVVERCSETIRTPQDAGYFPGDAEAGVLGSTNALWGDFFLIDAAGDLSQGFSAVALAADPEIRDILHGGFYGYEGDDRKPLGAHYRVRFFQGGAFDGGTEVLIWTGATRSRPMECGVGCDFGAFSAVAAEVKAFTETGERVFHDKMDFPAHTNRLRVGSEDLPIEARSGTLDFGIYLDKCRSRKCTPPISNPISGWVMPIYTAEERFSAGHEGMALYDPCRDF